MLTMLLPSSVCTTSPSSPSPWPVAFCLPSRRSLPASAFFFPYLPFSIFTKHHHGLAALFLWHLGNSTNQHHFNIPVSLILVIFWYRLQKTWSTWAAHDWHNNSQWQDQYNTHLCSTVFKKNVVTRWRLWTAVPNSSLTRSVLQAEGAALLTRQGGSGQTCTVYWLA